MRAYCAVSLFLIVYLTSSCTLPDFDTLSNRVNESLDGVVSSPTDIDPAGTNNFSFAVFGDTHLGSPFGALLDEALAKSSGAGDAFVVLAGDLTDNGKKSDFTSLKSSFSTFGMTFRAAIGNHDIYFGGWANYKNEIGASVYSFDADHVHFSIIDSGNGTIGSRQFNWLRSDLAQTSQAIKIIVTHFSPALGENQNFWRLSSDEESAILKDIASEYGVNIVISGHFHGYRNKRINGTDYITTGGVNKIIDLGSDRHYVQVSVNGTTITVTKVGL